ncbi:MAG: homocysteine S-methyltransferase family protein [Luminiphilus sp.]
MTHRVLLLDGGMGQELIRRSPSPAHHHWSLQVMLEQPELVAEVHRDFCEAGANVACLNTYAITHTRLARGTGLPQIGSLLNDARDLAQQGVEASGRFDTALVTSLPPLVASYRPDTQLPLEAAIQEYRELIELQAESVDGFIAETIPSIAEATAVLTAAGQAGVRIMLGLTVADDDGQLLRSGEPLFDALEAIDAFEPLAVVINCSKPEAVSQAIPILKESRFPFGAYANGFTAIDALEPGGVVDVLEARHDLDPEQYAKFAAEWLDAGASVIGGCCEVGPDHIKALSTLLQSRGHEQLAWGDLAA